MVMSNENKRLKLAFLNTLILQDKRTSWKITNEYIAQALQKHCGDITYIDPIQLRLLLLGKIVNKSAQLLLKKSFMYYHSFLVARRYGKIMTQKLATSDFDVIVAPSCATEIAYLETDIPIVLIEDANFAVLHDYYAQYSNLLKRSLHEVDMLESLALRKAQLALYPSQWAAQATRQHYAVDGQKVHTVSFGANIDHPPSIEVVQRRKKSDRCKLFFIGTDWERKGGEIAFEALLKLEELGIQAELTVCGCIPPDRFSHERMSVIPFLNRRDEAQRRQLESLFETSDFLFLPRLISCSCQQEGKRMAWSSVRQAHSAFLPSLQIPEAFLGQSGMAKMVICSHLMREVRSTRSLSPGFIETIGTTASW